MSYLDLKTPEERRRWAEERLELKKACSISERERDILDSCFASVKTEFSDLDGLKWTESEIRRRTPGAGSQIHANTATPFAVLTNDELSSFRSDETIRIKSPSKSNAPTTVDEVFKCHPLPAKDLSRYAEDNNERLEDAFLDIVDSMFHIPDNLGSNPSSPTPTQTLPFPKPPTSTTVSPRKLTRTLSRQSFDFHPQNKRGLYKLKAVDKPTTPNPEFGVTPSPAVGTYDLRDWTSGRSTGDPNLTPPHLRRKLRPNLPKKYLKGSGTDPYNPRYCD